MKRNLEETFYDPMEEAYLSELIAVAAGEGDFTPEQEITESVEVEAEIDNPSQKESQSDLNGIQRYLAEISKIPLLSWDEELALSRETDAIKTRICELLFSREELASPRFEEGVLSISYEQIARTLDERDKKIGAEAKEEIKLLLEKGEEVTGKIVAANLRLVIGIAKKYAYQGLPLLDLIQEGNVGLMRAAERFDWKMGNKFSTYANWWIRQAVERTLADNSRTVRIPVHVRDSLRKLEKVEGLLLQRLQREPKAEELAVELGFTVKKVRELLGIRLRAATVSLDMAIGNDETPLYHFIEDTRSSNPETSSADDSLKVDIDRTLATLSLREEKVIRMRLGIGEKDDHTLDEIGELFGLTRERIRQIEAKALNKLRHPSRKQKLEGYSY